MTQKMTVGELRQVIRETVRDILTENQRDTLALAMRAARKLAAGWSNELFSHLREKGLDPKGHLTVSYCESVIYKYLLDARELAISDGGDPGKLDKLPPANEHLPQEFLDTHNKEIRGFVENNSEPDTVDRYEAELAARYGRSAGALSPSVE